MDQVVTVDMVEEVVDIEMIEDDIDRKYSHYILPVDFTPQEENIIGFKISLFHLNKLNL